MIGSVSTLNVRGKRMIKDMWYCCPCCSQKLFKVSTNVIVKGIELKCKKCKKLIQVNIQESH